MMGLYIFMVAVFAAYVTLIVAQYGVLTSISESYYRLPRIQRPFFTLFCWGFAIPAILIGSTPLMFLAGTGIAFVGAAAAFKEEMTDKVHYIGAIGGILASQLSIAIDSKLYILNAVFLSGLTLLFAFKKRIINKKDEETYFWWIEILAFTVICIDLFTKVN